MNSARQAGMIEGAAEKGKRRWSEDHKPSEGGLPLMEMDAPELARVHSLARSRRAGLGMSSVKYVIPKTLN